MSPYYSRLKMIEEVTRKYIDPEMIEELTRKYTDPDIPPMTIVNMLADELLEIHCMAAFLSYRDHPARISVYKETDEEKLFFHELKKD